MSRGIGRNFFDTLLETKLEHPRHVSAIVRKRTEPVAIQLSIIYERTGDLSVDSRNFERGKRSAGNSPRAFPKECLRLPRAARKANLFSQRRKSNPFFETTDHSENEQKLASFLFSFLNLYFNKSVRATRSYGFTVIRVRQSSRRRVKYTKRNGPLLMLNWRDKSLGVGKRDIRAEWSRGGHSACLTPSGVELIWINFPRGSGELVSFASRWKHSEMV